MRRTLAFATLLLASAAAAPACLLDSGAFDSGGAAGVDPTGPGPGPGGAAGTSGAAGTAGVAGNVAGAAGTAGSGGSPMMCGNGMKDQNEQCDDGNPIADDGCTDCVTDPGYACFNDPGEPSICEKTCGDGVVEGDKGEKCDDGNLAAGDGCNLSCEVEPGWECDQAQPTMCINLCGNGKLDDPEECDGGMQGVEGCAANCTEESGWYCDNPKPQEPSVCETMCGDGTVAGPEKCDDGNSEMGDGCKADCKVEMGWICDPPGGPGSCHASACGDGVGVGGEDCDDGGVVSGDGCSADCKFEHTCKNGIVEPDEQCDGGMGCKNDCMLDGAVMGACTKAVMIPPGMLDVDTGMRVANFDGDSAGSTLMDAELSPQSCDSTINQPVLHRYKTGKQAALVTVEAMDTQLGGMATFAKTVVWVYRDCLGKRDVEGCANDGGAGGRAKFTTGYLPAGTTLFIALSGQGDVMDKGKYRLQITERPVKLFFYESFGPEDMAGSYPLPASLSQFVSGDGGWGTCVPGSGSPCENVNLDSHSGGAIGFAQGLTSTATNAILRSATLDTTPVKTARAQYTYRFINGNNNNSGKVDPLANGVATGNYIIYSMNEAGRAAVAMPIDTKARVDFIYNDGAINTPGTFSIDDLYVYGY